MKLIEVYERLGNGKFEIDVCCSSMEQALENGSDSEGYGCLADFDPPNITLGSMTYCIIKYCPWCGADTNYVYHQIKE